MEVKPLIDLKFLKNFFNKLDSYKFYFDNRFFTKSERVTYVNRVGKLLLKKHGTSFILYDWSNEYKKYIDIIKIEYFLGCNSSHINVMYVNHNTNSIQEERFSYDTLKMLYGELSNQEINSKVTNLVSLYNNIKTFRVKAYDLSLKVRKIKGEEKIPLERYEVLIDIKANNILEAIKIFDRDYKRLDSRYEIEII